MNLSKYSLVLIVVLLAASACAGGGATAEATPAAAQPAATNTPGPIAQSGQAGTFFAINEVGLGPEGFVALTNFTEVPVSLSGLYLCQGSDCFALPDQVVQGGETVRVAAGQGEGLENVIATGATFGELRPADGEIALFSSDKTDDPKALLVYLQWGSTPHQLTGLAVERGLWFETSYAPSGPNGTRLWRVEESGLWLWE